MGAYNHSRRKRLSPAKIAQLSSIWTGRTEHKDPALHPPSSHLTDGPEFTRQLKRKEQSLKHIHLRLRVATQQVYRARLRSEKLETKLEKTAADSQKWEQQFLDESSRSASLKMAFEADRNCLRQANTFLNAQLATQYDVTATIRAELELERKKCIQATRTLAETNAELLVTQTRLENVQKRQKKLRRSHDTLRKQRERKVSRNSTRQSRPPIPQPCPPCELTLKAKSGAIRHEVRDLLRQLAVRGVSTRHTMGVITHVLEAFGLKILDSISPRSISRVLLEGLLQSQVQIAHEISETNYLSICGDGTGIKNQQHEARLIRMGVHAPSNPNSLQRDVNPPPLRTLGVHKATNHTAKSQFNGWMKTVDNCFDLLTRIPLGQNIEINNHIFGTKLRGMLTDHASDQKLLVQFFRSWKIQCDRTLRGGSVLANMSTDEQVHALEEQLRVTCDRFDQWNDLPLEQQNEFKHDAWSALALTLGNREFQGLSEEEQTAADLLIWTGCCMHKELNAVKGGVASMSAAWPRLGLTPPIELKNKFELDRPTEAAPTSQAGSKINADSDRGGVKLASLAGAVFNHRDKQRGQQDTHRYYFEGVRGHISSFPDTSNTRYGSHCAAASELLESRNSYLGFLKLVQEGKFGLKFTNIERNVFNGLSDSATLTELAVLALYSQAVGQPYMAHVRGVTENALELGELHERVKNHCRAIIQNPGLLAIPTEGTLDGRGWTCPEVVHCIGSMPKELPHLREILIAFFEGALQAWERFTSEFAPDSLLSRTTPAQRQSIWNSPTNDASEGALGRCRQMLRHMPALTDNQLNARVMWSQNDTQSFVKEKFTEADHAFIRQEARELDRSGAAKKTRQEQNQAFIERARENRARKAKADQRRSEFERRLAGIKILKGATKEDLEKLTIPELNGQIDKLRQFDKDVPAKSKIGNKQAKITEILRALDCVPSTIGDFERENGAAESLSDQSSMYKTGGGTALQDEDMEQDEL